MRALILIPHQHLCFLCRAMPDPHLHSRFRKIQSQVKMTLKKALKSRMATCYDFFDKQIKGDWRHATQFITWAQWPWHILAQQWGFSLILPQSTMQPANHTIISVGVKAWRQKCNWIFNWWCGKRGPRLQRANYFGYFLVKVFLNDACAVNHHLSGWNLDYKAVIQLTLAQIFSLLLLVQLANTTHLLLAG